ncbi:MAG: GPR1/FUN34/YaaH family transporter [Pseudonocardia sp.]|jgi:uncharacterized protein
MSIADGGTDTGSRTAPAPRAAEPDRTPAPPDPTPAPAGNPALLGLMTFLPAGITLGLWLVGYLDTAALPGGMIPVCMFSAGLFLLVSAAWAGRLAANTVAAIFGVFSAFWLSFGFLLMSLNNGWIIDASTGGPITAAQVGGIQAAYVLSFLLVFVLLTVATLRMPLAFTVGFVFVCLTFLLVFLAVVTGNADLFTLAGIATFTFCAVFAYILYDGVSQDLGGKPLAMGKPLVK